MANVDETQIFLDFINTKSAITHAGTGFSNRIWADANEPESGYKPSDGIGLCLKVRGGVGKIDEDGAVRQISFQVKVYGGSEKEARRGARILQDELEDKGNKNILSIQQEAEPVTLQEPDARWIYVLLFYQVMIRNSTV